MVGMDERAMGITDDKRRWANRLFIPWNAYYPDCDLLLWLISLFHAHPSLKRRDIEISKLGALTRGTFGYCLTTKLLVWFLAASGMSRGVVMQQ